MLHKKVVTLVAILLMVSSCFVYASGDAKLEGLKKNVSTASNQYRLEAERLVKLKKETPEYQIQGELIDSGSQELVLWGTAFGSAAVQHKGWQSTAGNIKVVNPDQSKINYMLNFYGGPGHYYLRTEYGTNAFGAKVPVKVYTRTVPTALKSQMSKVDKAYSALSSKASALQKYANDKYTKALQQTSSASGLSKLIKDATVVHNFLVASKSNANLFSTLEKCYQKAIKVSPKEHSLLYQLAEFYSANNQADKASKVYTEVAKKFPQVFYKTVNQKIDLYQVSKKLLEVGYGDYAVLAIEAQMKTNPKLKASDSLMEVYVTALFSSAKKLKDSDPKKAEALEKVLLVNADSRLTNLGEGLNATVVGLLNTIYYSTDNIGKLEGLISAVGVGDFLDAKGEFQFEPSIIKLADAAAKAGSYRKSYQYFDSLLAKYSGASFDGRKFKDLMLNSSNEYANVMLGLVYSKYLRPYENEQLDLALKYLHKANTINASNAITNNALGYLIKFGYVDSPESFRILSGGTQLNTQALIKKAHEFYIKATNLKPDYKRAYGNLSALYSEIYKQDVLVVLTEISQIDLKTTTFPESVLSEIRKSFGAKAENKAGFEIMGIENESDF